MVRSLCAVVAKLTERFDQFCALPRASHPPPGASQLSSGTVDDLSFRIREEIVEMDERRKRRDSVIFRGVKVEGDPQAMDKIKVIIFSLLNLHPHITNLFCINREKGLYRIKMTEDIHRSQLLRVAKELRNATDYRGVYINSDLTYKQRQQLNERRQRLRSAGASQDVGAPQSSSSSTRAPQQTSLPQPPASTVSKPPSAPLLT